MEIQGFQQEMTCFDLHFSGKLCKITAFLHGGAV